MHDLGALANEGHHTVITELGRRMLAFPVHPRYARMLLAAQEYGCVHQACLVAALTQGRDLLLRNPRRKCGSARGSVRRPECVRLLDSDAGLEFRVEESIPDGGLGKVGIHGVTARQVGPLYDQFLRIARTKDSTSSPARSTRTALQKCILIGFSDRVGRMDRDTRRCELVHGRRGTLARESVVRKSPLIVAAEIREIGGRPGRSRHHYFSGHGDRTRLAAGTFSGRLQTEIRVTFDSANPESSRRKTVLRFRDLVVTARRVEPPGGCGGAAAGGRNCRRDGCQLPHWDHGIEQWILRLNLLAQWCPDLQLPPITSRTGNTSSSSFVSARCAYKDIKDATSSPWSIMAFAGSTRSARQARARAGHSSQRAHAQGDL